MNNWISVKDRLPEDDLPKDTNRVSIKVLVYSANGNKYSVRTLSRQRWIMNYKPLKYCDWEWSRDAKNITHWMEQTLSSIRMRSRRWWIKKIHLEVKMANHVI